MDDIKAQFISVLGAPIPFVAALFVTSAFMWALLNWRFAAKIERLQDEVASNGSKDPSSTIAPAVMSPAVQPAQNYEKVQTALSAEKNSVSKKLVADEPSGFVPVEKLLSLIAETQELTGLKKDALRAPYIGKHVKIVGEIENVSALLGIVSVDVVCMHKGKKVHFYCRPAKTKDEVSHFDKGDKVAVEGKINFVIGSLVIAEAELAFLK